jgi:hypothetical protein
MEHTHGELSIFKRRSKPILCRAQNHAIANKSLIHKHRKRMRLSMRLRGMRQNSFNPNSIHFKVNSDRAPTNKAFCPLGKGGSLGKIKNLSVVKKQPEMNAMRSHGIVQQPLLDAHFLATLRLLELLTRRSIKKEMRYFKFSSKRRCYRGKARLLSCL